MSSSRVSLTIEAVWKRAWTLLKTRWGALVAVLGLQSSAAVITSMFSSTVSDALTPAFSAPLKMLSVSPLAPFSDALSDFLVSLLIFPITSLLQAYASVGAVKIFLDVLRGQPFRWNRLLKPKILEWAYMVALTNIVFYATSFGFVLLLIPGLVLSVGFALSGLILIDKDADPIQALAESWQMMRGQKMFLFLNFILVGFAMVVGTLACLVGLFPAVMLSMLLAPVMYELLDANRVSQSATVVTSDKVVDEVPAPSRALEGSMESSLDADELDLDPDTDTEV
jgi:uncharacterized membrane protein